MCWADVTVFQYTALLYHLYQSFSIAGVNQPTLKTLVARAHIEFILIRRRFHLADIKVQSCYLHALTELAVVELFMPTAPLNCIANGAI